MNTPTRAPRLGRALLVFLAILANLVATAVPLLHALAHEDDQAHEQHGHPHAPSGAAYHEDHDEIHPTAFHDDWRVVLRATVDVAPVVSAVAFYELASEQAEAPPAWGDPVIRSRAPPNAPLARAPPPFSV